MFVILIIIIFGFVMGSFLNCMAWRICNNESFLRGRSKCPRCGHVLKWFELIPVLSFIIQKARCRRCREKISWQYPLVEIFMAGLFILSFWQYPVIDKRLIFNLFAISVLAIIFLTDFNFYIISDWTVWPAAIIVLIYQAVFGKPIWLVLVAAGVGGVFFGLQYVVSRGRWIGAGDIGLGFLMGAILGWPVILIALAFAYIGGAIVGLILILLKKKTWGDTLPLGAFLTPATIVTMLWGDKIVNWYGEYSKFLF